MGYRDSEFKEMLQAFNISSSLTAQEHVPENKVSILLHAWIELTGKATPNWSHSVSFAIMRHVV